MTKAHNGSAPHVTAPTTAAAVLQVLGAVRARVQRDPYQSLGLAAALGLTSGARLWGRLASLLLGAGGRLLVAAVVTPMLDELQSHHQEARHGRSPGT